MPEITSQIALAKEWASDLESGTYRQGRERLKVRYEEDDEVRYCCLGVLCESAIRIGVIEYFWQPSLYYKDVIQYGQYENHSTLPNKVADAIGLYENGCRLDGISWDFGGSGQIGSLVQANDLHMMSFAQIAGAIRSWIGELEVRHASQQASDVCDRASS